MPSATATRRSDRRGDVVVDDYLDARPRLLGAAYRTLGSWAEAEDIVQDAWLRWSSYHREVVDNPEAFLVTTTRRLAINAAGSARTRREVDGDPFLAEHARSADDPAVGAERRDEIELAIGLLLERLGPVERAAYLLRRAFDYPYARIAELLGVSETNVRKLVSRAGRRLSVERHHAVDRAYHQRLVRTFVASARGGDLGVLEVLLTHRSVPK
jgi:RNA polymerase sigma-70 factor (ECF subfamily)